MSNILNRNPEQIIAKFEADAERANDPKEKARLLERAEKLRAWQKMLDTQP